MASRRDDRITDQDVKLFTPGPLCVSASVRAAMLRDLGSRDTEFIEAVKFVRHKLVQIAGVSEEDYTAVPMQGSGTYAVESVFQTCVPRSNAKVLIFAGGAYGYRFSQICTRLEIDHDVIKNKEDSTMDLAEADLSLRREPYDLVAVVHCETTSGVVNPVEQLGVLVKQIQPNAAFLVDAMSSFGAIPLDVAGSGIDYLVSSSNKCLEGVPGFAFVIAKINHLLQFKGNSRSLSLDLCAQYLDMQSTQMFRFTPPTHVILAFQQALIEFEKEGGLTARAARYKANNQILRNGMKTLGFQEFVPADKAGYIITSFLYPGNENFTFHEFYERLRSKGQVLYPGKTVQADCFRIGNIGQLFPSDMEHLLRCIEKVCTEMGVVLPLQG